MAFGIAKVRTSITSSILVCMGQVRSPSASTLRIDVDGVVANKNQRLDMEVMKLLGV